MNDKITTVKPPRYNNRGGVRVGAGRPRAFPGTKKIQFSRRIEPETVDQIKELTELFTRSDAQTVERAVAHYYDYMMGKEQ